MYKPSPNRHRYFKEPMDSEYAIKRHFWKENLFDQVFSTLIQFLVLFLLFEICSYSLFSQQVKDVQSYHSSLVVNTLLLFYHDCNCNLNCKYIYKRTKYQFYQDSLRLVLFCACGILLKRHFVTLKMLSLDYCVSPRRKKLHAPRREITLDNSQWHILVLLLLLLFY